VRQSASNAMDFGQTHGLHGNLRKLYYAAAKWGHQALLTDIQKVSENIRASVQFPGTSCPTSISGERHAVRFRALPCEFSPAPPRKGGEGGDSNACNKFGPPPSPPFHAVQQKWEKWIFCSGEECREKVYLLGCMPFPRGPPPAAKPTFVTSLCGGWDSTEFSGGAQ